MTLPISRERALELVKKYNQEQGDLNHYLESEAVMREVAQFLNEDPEYYGMLGLLHDIDWGITKENPENHLTKAPDILMGVGFDDKFINTVISHGYGFPCANLENKKRTDKIQYALASSETITGLIHAYALMRGSIKNMEVKGLKKKFKDKKFASGVNREIIRECEHLNISVEKFFELAINAILKIADSVGLNK
jgi:putative nucleotidyltransferase with HDIG domain